MLRFECPHCKARCEAAPGMVGKSTTCPNCRKQVTVPANAEREPVVWLRYVIFGLIAVAVCGFIYVVITAEDGGGKDKGTVGANVGGNVGDTGAARVNVVMETSMGTVKMELYPDAAPITVENFLKYVDTKHYDGTVFHRVIPDFMVQGGGFEPGKINSLEKPTRPPIRNEAGNGLKNERGTLAMARTGDPNSATSQFFINVKYNDFLDRANAKDRVGYAVFGKVTDGMDVVDKIRTVRTGPNDVPVQDVIIKSIRRAD